MPSITNLKKHHYPVARKLKILREYGEGEAIDNVCYHNEIHKSTLYRWKKRFHENKELGLKRRPKASFNHPQKTKKDIAQKVIDYSIAHPNMGCCRVADALAKLGLKISSPTVQKILIESRLSKIEDRVYALENKHLNEGWQVSSETLSLISKINPCFKHHKEIGSYPGEILVQDTIPIFDYFENIYIYVVIDTYSYSTFTFPFNEKSAEVAIDVMTSKAIRFFRQKKFEVKKILTSKGSEFTKFNKYTQYFDERNISHITYKGKLRNWHGYIEKYKRHLFNELSKLQYNNLDYVSLREFDRKFFNDIRNNQKIRKGFPTFGKSPLTIMSNYLKK